MVIQLDKKQFQEKVFDFSQGGEWKFEGDKPAIIDFYADWCGPCKMIAPIMEELAELYKGQVDFYKINTEIEMELSAAFGIQSIPSLLFVTAKQDEKPQLHVGALPKESMVKAISEVFGVEAPAAV